MKLLLIDNRVPDIETIIGSINESTACVVFNYYHDTRDTLLSKIKFLNQRNRVIRDNFYYETPPVPVITDLSSCHSCDVSGNPKMYTTSVEIAMQALEYAASNGNATNSDATTTLTVPPTPWITASVQSSGPAPVFFQRVRPVTDSSGTTVLYPEPLPVLVSELDDIYDTFKTIPYEADTDNAVGGYTEFTTVGIIQHAYVMNGSDTYTFLKMLNPDSAILKNVITVDPALQTWEPFISTISAILTRHQTTTLDLMACALYADPNWKYVIDELQIRMAVNVRASLDNTGSSSMGGNWILESDSANLKDVYFTDAIDGWNHLLATITDTRFYTLAFNNSMYLNYAGSSSVVNVGLGDFTFETWYYETSRQTNCTIFDKGNYNYTWQIRNANINGGGLSLYNLNMGWLYAETPVVPQAQWSHLAITRSGSTFKFYINGTLMQTMTNNTTLYNNGSNFCIGLQSPDSCSCNLMKTGCRLYDARMWNVCRTDSQIQLNRNRIVPANSTGLVANYILSFPTSTAASGATSISDRTSNGINMNFQNYSNTWANDVVVPNIGFYISNNYSLTATNATNYGDLTFTDFSGVNFAGVNFTGTNLSGSKFTNCNFTGATLSSITVTAATDFTGANFTSITSSNVTGTPILPSGYIMSGSAIVQNLPAPTIDTFASIPTKTFGTDVSFSLTDPSSNSTGAFTYSSSNTSVATILSRTVTITGVGSSTITATQASDGTYQSASVSTTLTVNSGPPTFGPFTLGPKSGVYVLADVSFSLTAPTSNSAGSFTYTSDNSAVAVVSTLSAFTTSNLLARYDASVPSSYVLTSGNVTQWNDLTGNGYHLIQNGTGPTVSAINSITALDFNSGRGFSAASVPLNTSVTVFMVTRYSSNIAVYGNFMHHGDRDNDWSLERIYNYSDITFQSNNVNNVALTVNGNTNYILIGRTVGNTREFWRYSNTVATGFSSGTPVTIGAGNKTLYVGMSDSGEGCNSIIGEIMYYNDSLSNADVSANLLYLQNKWFNGITTGTGSYVSLLSNGTANITATQDACGNFLSSSVSSLLLVGQRVASTFASSTFTVASSKTILDTSFTVTTRPTSNSSGAITYTSNNPSVATIDASGNFITVVGLGTVTFTATQAETTDYLSANRTSNTLTISKAIPTLSFISPPATKNVTDAAFTVIASSASSAAVTYSSSNTSFATVDGSTGLVTLKGAGNVTIIASQASTATYESPTNATCSIVISYAGTALQGQTVSSSTSYASVDLSGASLAGTTVSGVSFSGANLSNVNFSGAIITGTDFTNANISGATNLPTFSTVQKLQLLKNINNVEIGAVQVSEPVSGSDINALLSISNESVAVAVFTVKAPTTVDASANKVVTINSGDISGNKSVYIPMNANETVKINNVVYSFNGTSLLDINGNVVRYTSFEGSLFKIYAGSIVALNVTEALNKITFSGDGLFTVLSQLFNLKS